MATNTKRLLIALAVIVVLAVAATATGLAVSRSGGDVAVVNGTVMRGPMLPVDRPEPQNERQNWVSTPAIVVAYDVMSGRRAAETRSGSDGRFTMRLLAGEYRLLAMPVQAGMLLMPHPVVLTVESGKSYTVKLWLDTGIRGPVNPGGPMIPAGGSAKPSGSVNPGGPMLPAGGSGAPAAR